MSRRQALRLLTMGAVAVGGMSLTGCGGLLGGGGGGGNGVGSTMVGLTLPPGFSLNLAELAGETAWDSQPLGAGSFPSKVILNGRPTLAFFRHLPADKHVMLGIAGDASFGVSAKGCAIALIALSIGIFGLPPDAAWEAIALIDADPATDTLAAVIEARLAVDPYCLFDGDPQIRQALLDAYNAIAAESQPRPKGNVQRPLSNLLLIQEDEQSMTRMNQAETDTAIKVVNLGRRPITALTYRTKTQDENGILDLPVPVPIGSPQQIRATTGILGALSSLGSSALFAPVEGPILDLPASEGKIKTFYETIVLMASGKNDGLDPDPAFFSDTRYANLVQGWRDERRDLNIYATFGGIVFELTASVLGGTVGYMARAALAAALAELEAIEAGTVQAFLSQRLRRRDGRSGSGVYGACQGQHARRRTRPRGADRCRSQSPAGRSIRRDKRTIGRPSRARGPGCRNPCRGWDAAHSR